MSTSLAGPTLIKRTWFPASVKLPDVEVPWYTVKVYATDLGLLIYTRVPADGITPDWRGDIDYDTAPEPRGNAKNGVTVQTAAGPVIITASGGCGCGNALKRWKPQGAMTTSRWAA